MAKLAIDLCSLLFQSCDELLFPFKTDFLQCFCQKGLTRTLESYLTLSSGPVCKNLVFLQRINDSNFHPNQWQFVTLHLAQSSHLKTKVRGKKN